MERVRTGAILALSLALAATAALAADKKEFKYSVGPRAMITLVNDFGPVTVKAAPGRQVIITATSNSDDIQVDSAHMGSRVTAKTHAGKGGEAGARVEYDVVLPQDASVNVRARSGPVLVERLRNDVTVEAEAAEVHVRDLSGGHVHVRTVTGPVTLTNISSGHIEVTSISGNVELQSVSGPKVVVNTTKGGIRYAGDFGGSGEYLLASHSGDIDASLPTSASVDLRAQSVRGTVENDFPLQEKPKAALAAAPQRSFAGTLNTGASSVELRSFSGKIRVKKQ